MPKITDAGYGDLTSYVATFKLIGHDPTEGSVADQTKRLALNDLKTIMAGLAPDGTMFGGKISVTVVSNDLVVAIKTTAGADPSATDSVAVKINGTVRTISAATSITLADATNWFNAGGAELAAKEIDYFLYAIWDSNSSVVAIGPARIPYATLVSDFSATTTNEKYLGNYANYTSTDDVVVLGRFAATLSAGAGYTWTVPTFTSANLIHRPIFETRRLDYTPAHSRTGGAYTNAPTTSFAHYQIIGNRLMIYERHSQNATPGSSGAQTVTAPFTNGIATLQGLIAYNATSLITLLAYISSSSNTITIYKYDGTAEATASHIYGLNGMYFI